MKTLTDLAEFDASKLSETLALFARIEELVPGISPEFELTKCSDSITIRVFTRVEEFTRNYQDSTLAETTLTSCSGNVAWVSGTTIRLKLRGHRVYEKLAALRDALCRLVEVETLFSTINKYNKNMQHAACRDGWQLVRRQTHCDIYMRMLKTTTDVPCTCLDQHAGD